MNALSIIAKVCAGFLAMGASACSGVGFVAGGYIDRGSAHTDTVSIFPGNVSELQEGDSLTALTPDSRMVSGRLVKIDPGKSGESFVLIHRTLDPILLPLITSEDTVRLPLSKENPLKCLVEHTPLYGRIVGTAVGIALDVVAVSAVIAEVKRMFSGGYSLHWGINLDFSK